VAATVSKLNEIFPGHSHSEMANRLRCFDWAQNPLGPPETWGQNLKTCVRIILTSRHPMLVWWGNRLINLYNDGYAAFLWSKHPAALGQPASGVWPEIWEQIGPRAEFAMRQHEGTYDESLHSTMYRKGYPEETYVTFSYSHIYFRGFTTSTQGISNHLHYGGNFQGSVRINLTRRLGLEGTFMFNHLGSTRSALTAVGQT
jgi:hypothetical protein